LIGDFATDGIIARQIAAGGKENRHQRAQENEPGMVPDDLSFCSLAGYQEQPKD
jgi:hypothetical protein